MLERDLRLLILDPPLLTNQAHCLSFRYFVYTVVLCQRNRYLTHKNNLCTPALAFKLMLNITPAPPLLHHHLDQLVWKDQRSEHLLVAVEQALALENDSLPDSRVLLVVQVILPC